MAKRRYEKGDLVVLWDSDLCIHCEDCWRNLPSVFDPEKRPWVNLDGAEPQAIRERVSACPSAALSLGVPDESAAG